MARRAYSSVHLGKNTGHSVAFAALLLRWSVGREALGFVAGRWPAGARVLLAGSLVNLTNAAIAGVVAV